MSGSTGANLPIDIRLTGTAEAEAAFNRVSNTAGTAMQRVEQSTGRASGGMRNFSQVAGQAGFQLQDFAVQVQGGTSALTALSQQGSQFLGVFGTGGAVAGAVLTVGILATQIISMGESASAAEARIKTAFDGIKAESEGVRDLIKEIGDLFKSAAERARELALAQRGVLANNADLRLSNSIQLQDAAATRLPVLEAEIAVLERRAQVEAELARRAGRGGLGAPVDQTTDTTSALFVARSQLNGLRSEMDLQSRRIGELNAARGALSRTGADQGEGQYGPAAPASIEQTRQGLERDYALRQQHAERITSINVALAQGNVSAADATNLRAASERKLAEDLASLASRQAGATQALREYETLQRSTTGLLVGNASEARVAGEIAAQIRGTAADPALRTRQEAETARREEREADRRQAETDRFSERWGDRIALETTRGLFEGTKNGETAAQRFGTALRGILMSSVSAVISRNLFQPLVSAGYNAFSSGGASLGLGNFFGGGAAGVSNAGSLAGGVNQLGQFSALSTAGGYGNLGAAFTNAGPALTGFSGLDGFLNATVAGGANAGINAGGAATNAAGYGSIAANSIDAAGSAAAAGVGSSSLSVAGAIGGAAGIAGGAYGIYSGLQRGGIGGYTSAAGGALSAGLGAATLASLSVPVYGWIAAAVLAIVGALLPGEKASGKGQESRINLDTDALSFAGLGGDRFSQGNRNVAGSSAQSIADLARQVGDKLGGARIGGNIAVGVTSSRGDGPGTLYLDIVGKKAQFTNDEGGSKQLAERAAQLIVEEFKLQARATGDYATILNNSPNDIQKLGENLEWYEKVYKGFEETQKAASAFDQAMKALNEQWQPSIDKARELGLSIERITDLRQGEIDKLTAQRDTQSRRFDLSLDARTARLAGNDAGADYINFNLQAEQELQAARKALEDLGLTSEEVAIRMARNEQILADERAQIQQRSAEQLLRIEEQKLADARRAAQELADAQISSARTVLDWLNGQALGASSSLSPTARLSEAERQFNEAAASGDAGRLTNAADALLDNSRDVFGGATAAYAQREAFVRQTVLNRGAGAAWGGGDTATIAALSQMTVALTAELAAIRASFEAMAAETRRTNNLTLVAA